MDYLTSDYGTEMVAIRRGVLEHSEVTLTLDNQVTEFTWRAMVGSSNYRLQGRLNPYGNCGKQGWSVSLERDHALVTSASGLDSRTLGEAINTLQKTPEARRYGWGEV